MCFHLVFREGVVAIKDYNTTAATVGPTVTLAAICANFNINCFEVGTVFVLSRDIDVAT